MTGVKKEDKMEFKSGYATIIGAPNAGKSTLLNAVLGEKIAIATPKPQTTRDAILGIKHLNDAQIVFVDTPGIHRAKGRLNKAMVKNALDSLGQVDVVLFMVDAARQSAQGQGTPLDRDLAVAKQLADCGKPIIMLLNKTDKMKKEALLPVIDSWGAELKCHAILPLSALRSEGLDMLLKEVVALFGAGPAYFPDDMVTDRSMRFLTSEVIREKLFMQLDQEMPYSIAVEVEAWNELPKKTEIQAVIHVERDSQKRIVVGAGGQRIKAVGMAARKELERMIGRKVYLELFVRVEAKWSESQRSLERFGYMDRDRRGK